MLSEKVPVTSWGPGEWLTRKGMGALQVIQISRISIGFVLCECFHQKLTSVYKNMCISSHINFTCKCKILYYEVNYLKTNKEPSNLETEIGLTWSSGSSIGNVRWWANLSILLQCILVRYLYPWDMSVWRELSSFIVVCDQWEFDWVGKCTIWTSLWSIFRFRNQRRGICDCVWLSGIW